MVSSSVIYHRWQQSSTGRGVNSDRHVSLLPAVAMNSYTAVWCEP